MTLQNFQAAGWLVDHQPSATETQKLRDLVAHHLRDAHVEGSSFDARFAAAYHAILAVAKAALSAEGFRTKGGESGHIHLIRSLRFTLGTDADLERRLESFRRKRHTAFYDEPELISQEDLRVIVALAEDLQGRLATWLGERHRKLLAT